MNIIDKDYIDYIFSIAEHHLGRKLTDAEKQNINTGGEVRKAVRIDKSNCVNILDLIRKQECPSCSGNIQIKIFSCSIHGECCLSDKLPQIKNCNTCEDFVAKE